MAATNDLAIEWYQKSFKQFTESMTEALPKYFKEVQQEAFRNFEQQGFPTTRNEEWRYTNVQPIAKQHFKPLLLPDGVGLTVESIRPWCYENTFRLVFVNGLFAPQLSHLTQQPDGVTITSVTNALKNNSDRLRDVLTQGHSYENNPFEALNVAFLQDGAFVHVKEGCIVEKPIHCLFLTTAQADAPAVQPHNIFIADRHSRCSFFESYVGLGDNCYLSNPVTTIIVDEEASVEHDKLQIESPSSYHIATQKIQQKNRSTFLSNSIVMGGSIVRNTITSHLDGEGIVCTLNGLSLGTGDQLIDNHTAIDHAKPHCESHELYKAILDGKSRGVFNGKIFVRKDAQKTDAKQTNKTLILSDDATIDTKPQLEIFADDVKCTHGATVGQLDEQQVFYLRSRGIAESRARDILTYAFAADVVDRVQIDQVKKQLEVMIHHRLDQGRLLEETI